MSNFQTPIARLSILPRQVCLNQNGRERLYCMPSIFGQLNSYNAGNACKTFLESRLSRAKVLI